MRKLEKISFKQFKKDINDSIDDYNSYMIPKRHTKNSAGYDFAVLENYIIEPGEIKKIPTGIKACMNDDEMFLLVVRSSMGFKYNIRLCNQVGVIDSDYYNNIENEGHMWIAIQNEGEKEVILEKGQRFAQGLFVKYLTVDNEEPIEKERVGKTGSTEGDK